MTLLPLCFDLACHLAPFFSNGLASGGNRADALRRSFALPIRETEEVMEGRHAARRAIARSLSRDPAARLNHQTSRPHGARECVIA
jgi:hypothetical protein